MNSFSSSFTELYPNKQTELNDFRTYLIEGSNPMTPLKAWQMQDLSLQCAFRAISESNPEEAFNTLVELSQNFPSRARYRSFNIILRLISFSRLF